ncbi:hypothetical protein [Polaromonas sp. LjRoot131]|uniref:hypothetical protein n=1 Tax=Polaromonas sp. LjRoot131 TaxID=3342262 RepID=UPI003ECCF4CA
MKSSDVTGEDTPDDEKEVLVPEDFPHDPFPTTLTGTQPKVAAREVDGRYVVGLTEEERRGRYLMCIDLVEQLTDYTERKRIERHDLTLTKLLDEVDVGIRRKGWELGKVEFDWIMSRLRSHFL